MTSPYKAVITQVMVGSGQWLSLESPIVQIEKLSDAEVVVKLPNRITNDDLFKTAVWLADSEKEASELPLELLRVSPYVERQSLMRSLWYRAPNGLLTWRTGTSQVYFSRSSSFARCFGYSQS